MNTTRRGFLGAMLAAAAAPAFVRADSLMQIVVPKQEIILPTLNILIPEGAGAGVYTASMWVKASGGEWERIVKTVTVGEQGRAFKMELPHKDPLVWGVQLEMPKDRPVSAPPISFAASDGVLRMDETQNPYMPGERIGMSRHTVEGRT